MKKTIFISMCLILYMMTLSALAERDPWDCICGKKSNTSNFCGICGRVAPIPVWDCACGNTENTGNFCPECGNSRPTENYETLDFISFPEGSSEKTATFSVQSNGNAQITLTRTKARCQYLTYKKQVVEDWGGGYNGSGYIWVSEPTRVTVSIPDSTSMAERWGEFNIRIIGPDGHTAEKVWDNQERGSECTLTLPTVGIYKIQIIPFTTDQMNNDNSNGSQFNNWITYPEWKVVKLHNCYIGG